MSAGLNATQVDERDSTFEIETPPVFRVFFWEVLDGKGRPDGSAVFDIRDATARSVIDWARARSAGHALVQVFVRVELRPGTPGIVLIDSWETGENVVPGH